MKTNRKQTEKENITFTVNLKTRGFKTITYDGKKFTAPEGKRLFLASLAIHDEKNKWMTQRWIIMAYDPETTTHGERREDILDIVKTYIEWPEKIDGNRESTKIVTEMVNFINEKTYNGEEI